jgi:mannose-6-phosphate isomerase-like protein (cupin superfamily)
MDPAGSKENRHAFPPSTGRLVLGRRGRRAPSSRHMHNLDQIRYVLEGETGFTKWDLHAGECAYFPAGAHYGPQKQHGSAPLLTRL